MFRRPPPLAPGDRVGVAALSGWAAEDRLRRGIAALRELGYEPVPADNVGRREGVFAGTDAERLDGLHGLLEDEDLAAVFFLRGGHGVLRLLDRLDWDLVGRRPRAFVGYSDLTPLLLEISRRFGWITFHGPMVGVELARGLVPEERASLIALLGGDAAPGCDLSAPAAGDPVEGVLWGGCLSLLCACLGTEFTPTPPPGAILFWEDVDEPFYRVDRMLTQLRLSGSVATLSGMVTGRTGLEAVDLERLGRDLRVSFATGLSSGHCNPNLTLPLGAKARVDPQRRRIDFDLD